jgi:DNA-binding transcriptional ArsR family regulator
MERSLTPANVQDCAMQLNEKNDAPSEPRGEAALGSMPLAEMARHAEDAAQFLKLMANPHRLMILCHLLESELSVSEINEHVPLSQSALSQHLAVLRNSGMVSTRREQQTIHYRLANSGVRAIMDQLYMQFCAPSITDKDCG